MIKVENMMCQHCVKRIAKILNDSAIEATIDLASKSVILMNGNDATKAIELLNQAGYVAKIEKD